MTWECIECGDRENAGEKMQICHHCGKTVCHRHREMISDDAFSSGPPPNDSRLAVHCGDCRKEFHRTASIIEATHPLARKVSAS